MMAHSAIAPVSIYVFVEKKEMAIVLYSLEMLSKVLLLPVWICVVLSFYVAVDSYDSSKESD